jgi:hypothetical protein
MISHGNIAHTIVGLMVYGLETAKILEVCMQRSFIGLPKTFASLQYGTLLMGFKYT